MLKLFPYVIHIGQFKFVASRSSCAEKNDLIIGQRFLNAQLCRFSSIMSSFWSYPLHHACYSAKQGSTCLHVVTLPAFPISHTIVFSKLRPICAVFSSNTTQPRSGWSGSPQPGIVLSVSSMVYKLLLRHQMILKSFFMRIISLQSSFDMSSRKYSFKTSIVFRFSCTRKNDDKLTASLASARDGKVPSESTICTHVTIDIQIQVNDILFSI